MVKRLKLDAKGTSLVGFRLDRLNGQPPDHPCRIRAGALAGLQGLLNPNYIKVCADECQGLFPHLSLGVSTVSTSDGVIEGSEDHGHNREGYNHFNKGEAGIVPPHGAPRSMWTTPVSHSTPIATDCR